MEKYLSLFENTNIKKEEFKNFKIEYNEEQLKFINSPLENSKLLGIPGGGKTQSIIGKILKHYSCNDINAKNQFLILTFSRRACNDFIEKGKRQNRILFTNKNIKTLHSLAGKIIYKVLVKNSSSQDTIIISSIDLIETNSEKILEMDEFINLKVIFVDEAQDISYIQYQLILKISKLTNCSVILIGDPNQNIYQFQNGSDHFLLNHPGNTYNLIKNYRSTQSIVNFINSFRPWNKLTDTMVSTKDSNEYFNKKPIIFNGTIDEIIKDIINKILSSPFPREEIAIIGPVKKSKPNNDSYSNIGLSLFTNILSDYNIKFIKHYDDIKNEDDTNSETKRIKDYINLMTIHGSKGLEFHQVFLINFHTSTFGIIPTEEKYKEFKYLWYVGLSRASYELNIYVDKSKLVWNELKNCSTLLYDTNDYKPKFTRDIKFQEEIEPIYYSVTEILNSKKIMSDETIFNLENIFKHKIEVIPMYNDFEVKNIKNYKEYSALYGMFIENIFNYYYNKNFNRKSDFIAKLYKIINNTIVLPKELVSGYKLLKIRCPFIKNNLIKLSDFSKIKNLFKRNEEEVYSYLCEIINNDYNMEFFLDCHNYVINYSKEDLLYYIKQIENGIDITNNIFKITIFYYQMNNETAYLWKVNMDEELNDLKYYIDKIIVFVNELGNKEDFKIHKLFKHPKLALVGELDMISENKIVDIKFTNNISIKHILQLLFYNNIVDPKFDKEYELELWNFHLGNKYIIKINRNEIDKYKFLKLLSKSIGKKLENMIFLYDLETTGLLYANKKIDIIERHFEEYTTGIIASTGLIKPINVPFIPFEITKLTGITKELVFDKGDSMEIFKKEMSEIMEYCYNPIFIAHNGNSFDHKIMLDKNLLTYNNCKLLDSRIIIRLFLNDQISEKSLSDIFLFLFNFKPVIRRANSDVKMLLSIFEKLNISEDKILNM